MYLSSHREAGELIISMTYGYTISPHDEDPLVALVDTAMAQFSAAIVPGRWLVDVFPFLQHVPAWVPGAGFKDTARLWRSTLMDVVDIPYAFVKEQMKRGTARESFVSRLLEEQSTVKEKDEEEEESKESQKERDHAIRWTSASLYTGGADTSVSTMTAFFLAMAKYPQVQRKAQAELDSLLDKSSTPRLPTFADRPNLPYLNAIVEEAQRWHPIAVMGLPHATDAEDSIAGYRIPKGALLLPAIWWFTRDPTVYHDAETFKPERFLAPYNEPPATSVTFGFGRRVCPGRVLADSSLFLTFARALAVFDISAAADGDGDGDGGALKHGFEKGIIARPEPFEVRLRARSEAHEALIEAVVKEYPWEEGDARYVEGKRAA